MSSFGQGSLMQMPSPSEGNASVALYSLRKELKSGRKLLSASKAGIDVFKVAKNGKLQPRRVALSYDNRSILVTSNKIKSIRGLLKALSPQETTARSIDISSVERIEQGHQSNRFIQAKTMERLPSREHGPSASHDSEEANCLSIVYRVSAHESASFTEGLGAAKVRGPHRFNTLDLLVPKDEDYELLLQTLQDLLALYRDERNQYDTFSLFCEFQWIDLAKDRNSTMSSSEWVTFCDKCNAGMKKSAMQAYYREYAEEHGLEDEGLSMADAMELLQEVKETMANDEDPLMDLWDSLVTLDPVPPLKYENEDEDEDMELHVNNQEESISAVAFLSFIRSEQREFEATLDDVHNLLTSLQSLKCWMSNLEREDDDLPAERLSKSNFFTYLSLDANDIFEPSEGKIGATDMDHPLSHYWINTSHDTYLAKLPDSFRFKDMDYENYHAVDAQSYINALNRGVRCLELDVYDGLLCDDPVIGRKMAKSASDNQCIPFDQVLKSVRAFLRSNESSYPVILYLETHCSVQNQEMMAKYLEDILGSEGMLYKPPDPVLANQARPLPSPTELQGKVLIKNKRPKIIREGATVLNDDLDEDQQFPLEDDDVLPEDGDADDDENEEEEERGVVVRFDAAGPIRSTEPNAPKLSPSALLEIARRERQSAKHELVKARAKEIELKEDAKSAESRALLLMKAAGLTADAIQALAVSKNKMIEEEGDEDDESNERGELNGGSTSADTEDGPEEEGLEVQHFFGSSVEGARSEYSEADAHASMVGKVAAEALARLNDADAALADAHDKLQKSYQSEIDLALESKRQANLARANREHADTAERRVETVKALVRNSRNTAASAGTVVVTAMTEAKISEQRASETEARAARALSLADKERVRAESETGKEEILEQEVNSLHDRVQGISREAKVARDRMVKIQAMLDRVNEQIKLIEKSSQYQKESKLLDAENLESDDLMSAPRHGGTFVAKHAAKLEERRLSMEQMKEATIAYQEADSIKNRLQSSFQEKVHIWKVQVEVASQARKQADRSSQHAEELAEHAEEEREAASLRHIACEKAQSSVSQTDSNQSSFQAQLIEAARAAEEAASLALESRMHAEKIAREAEYAKDHSAALLHVENMKIRRKEAQVVYDEEFAKKEDADSKAAAAKRLLDTSSEVFTKAKRDAAAAVNNANAKRQIKREAVQAYRTHLVAKKLVEGAVLQTKLSRETALEKTAAEVRAEDYKFMMDKRSQVAPELARLSLLHSTKFKGWEKAEKLPDSHMHSISQVRVSEMLEKDTATEMEKFVSFTENHLLRTFPSWGLMLDEQETNYDPVAMHALGCQLVSMNFHSANSHLLLNDGRFRMNGSSGYILKPLCLTSEEEVAKWKITVLAGMFLPKPESIAAKKIIGPNPGVSPFVRVSVHTGKMDDESPLVHETEPVHRNGLNPVWDEHSHFEFEVENPSIAMILFSVWDDDSDDFIAAAALPVGSMRQGYRKVALFDSLHSRSGPYGYASLVVRAQKV